MTTTQISRLHRLFRKFAMTRLLLIPLLLHLPRKVKFRSLLTCIYLFAAASASSSTKFRRQSDESSGAEGSVALPFFADAGEEGRSVSELMNWYNSTKSPAAFGMRRLAIDKKFDGVTKKWMTQTSLRYRSEHAELPSTTTTPFS